ncbi:MAG: carboxymuconolactone decarboxylase family protein [Parvularculaceae bacterium]
MSEHRAAGLKKLAEIDGDDGVALVRGLESFAPDMAHYVTDFAFGDIYARPGLDLRSREIAAVAALSALGHAPAQLRLHVNGALNVGCTPEEVIEIILQTIVFAGFPAALNAIAVAREVFESRPSD